MASLPLWLASCSLCEAWNEVPEATRVKKADGEAEVRPDDVVALGAG
jgi:hypothetical protein